MKTTLCRLFAATLAVGALLSSHAYSQQPLTNRPMLGPGYDNGAQITPLGITVFCNGFDEPLRKQIRRSAAWMRDNGFGGLVGQFAEIAMHTDAMLADIDAAWLETEAGYAACGWTRAARLDPHQITVILMASPFQDDYYGPNVWLAGIVKGDTIKVVNVHVHLNPDGTAFLQDYKNLVFWEFNNRRWCEQFGCPRDLSEEISAQRPCGT